MKLLACIKKDIRLICGGGARGIVLIILPVLLVFLNYLEPFAIAVRDEDGTMMSNLLMAQLRNIPLFSEVRSAGSSTDEELCAEGCAAVITVPKDFFYDLYDMRDTDTMLLLNMDMPREAAAVKSAVASLAGIIEQNQRVFYAEARVRYGELDDEELERVYYEYSDASVRGALERLDFFELTSLYADEEASTLVFFAAGVCSMLLMFIPLSVLRNLHEETELGIAARLTSAGGSIFDIAAAKLIASFVMTALPVAALLLILKVPNVGALILPLILLFLCSFAFFLFIALVCRSAERAQLTGNMLMLLMLAVGGALLPYRLLPSGVQRFSALTLPYYTARCMHAAALGRSGADMLKLILPVIVCIPVFLILGAAAYAVSRRAGRRRG